MTLYPVIVTVTDSEGNTSEHVVGYIPHGYSTAFARLAAKAMSTAVWLSHKRANRKVRTSWRWGDAMTIEIKS